VAIVQPRQNPRVYLEFAEEGAPLGRVVIGLFAHKVPRPAEKFRMPYTGGRVPS
jgi:hypothetical protein